MPVDNFTYPSGNAEKGREYPLVSVVVPAYNAARFIAKTMDSVFAQTYENWEMIVVDDCSNDSTVSIVEEYCAVDSRVKLVRGEANQGVAAVRNKGFALAAGEYVAMLDSDDLWHREKLEKQVELARRTGADIVYCSYSIVDEEGKKACEDFLVSDAIDFEGLLTNRVISCSTALLSSGVAKGHVFLLDKPHEDYVYWLTLLKEGYKASGLKEVLGSYRIHGGSRSSNKLKNAFDLWGVYRKDCSLSFGECVGLLVKYALGGLKKYRSIS